MKRFLGTALALTFVACGIPENQERLPHEAMADAPLSRIPAEPSTEFRADCYHGHDCIANCWGGAGDWFYVMDWGKGSCTGNANHECWLKGKRDGKAWGVCSGQSY